jgi:hypothetical protein
MESDHEPKINTPPHVETVRISAHLGERTYRVINNDAEVSTSAQPQAG